MNTSYLVEQVRYTQSEVTTNRAAITAAYRAADQGLGGWSSTHQGPQDHRSRTDSDWTTSREHGTGQPRLKDAELNAAAAESGVCE